MSRLLLHVCCGPCAEYPIEALKREERFEHFDLYYFNPNIQPEIEWERRLEGVTQLAQLRDLKLTVRNGVWQAKWEALGEGPQRCAYCYNIRMEEAAKMAAEGGYEAFTTSLLVSPYQNREAILQAGVAAAKRHGLIFEPYDFREGFRLGQQMAREDGLYRQKYCGCIFSLRESDFRAKIEKQHAELLAAKALELPAV